jgi:hypothetical protein
MSPGGRYTRTIDGVTVRTADGVHLSEPGGEWIKLVPGSSRTSSPPTTDRARHRCFTVLRSSRRLRDDGPHRRHGF